MNRKIALKIIFFIVLAFIVIGIYKYYIYDYSFTTTCYSITSEKINNTIRIIQITDLHNSEFGSENKRLVEEINKQEPDLILITGDLLNVNEENSDVAVTVIERLSQIAPVYFSLGNHEKDYETVYGIDITSLFEQAGAKVLEYSYQDIEINNQQIRLGGIYGYCLPEKYLKTNEADPEECAFLTDFQDTDLYTILLCHMPYSWLCQEGLNEWDIDCVFCGHVHGGQIRIPFIGGLWAPDQGWFPGREAGLYYSDDKDKVMVLSRGLGNTEIVPRFNNRPEIVVVDIIPQE